METQLATITFDNMASSAPQFLTPEDLQSVTSPSPSPSPPFEHDNQNSITMTQASPSAITVHSKPAKKRKSWGQALPEPKTMLPPRKRAKTDDEKEQRRIERIKRNRAAAHNSRERKRQETETLAVALARANAELEAYRNLHGPLPSHIVLPEVTLDNGESPVPALTDSHDTPEEASSPASPPQNLIKEEPLDAANLTFIPPAFEYLDAKATTLSLDPTQHSAVSVEPERSEPSFNNIDFSQLLGGTLPASHDASATDLLQDYSCGNLDTFAFADDALDASFNAPLDFSFDDFIHDSAASAIAVDGHGAL